MKIVYQYEAFLHSDCAKRYLKGKTDNHIVGEKAKGWDSVQVLSFEAQRSRKLQNTNG